MIESSMPRAAQGRERDVLHGDLQRLAALGEMTAAAVHDFNNLLQVVVSALRVIEGQLDPVPAQDVKDLFAQGLSAAQRAAFLSRRLLSYGTASGGTATRFELGAALRGSVPMLRWILGTRIGLRQELHEEPLVVECCPHELEQGLLNLAANARDAMSGTGTLTLRSEVVPAPSPSWPTENVAVISVVDEGCGMPEVVQEKAFERYFTTKGAGGSGIGLFAVREFARRNGGDAWFRSAPGQGTTVTVALPCRPLD
ncbi:sensor histidine kinase [Roseomonas populi]|uniref:histidine kinase n=1 Tax=Roseomonas populi TaxID=3121582 RepID=A0ABT1XC78_9PROT|nr:ATP-binding protein [Roseomonas pecuniae]MCR0985544.1 ATP-binding protein [Roseomonas pecuniae]